MSSTQPTPAPDDSILVANRSDIRVPTKPRVGLPVVQLRPYADQDLAQTQHIFYSTYFNLVPQGIWLRLRSPLIFVPWLSIITLIQYYAGGLWSSFIVASWIDIATRIISFLGSITIPAVLMFVWVDRFGIMPQVEASLDGDLRDPEVYYMGWNHKQTNPDGTPYVRVQPPKPSPPVAIWRAIVHGDKKQPSPPEVPIVRRRRPKQEQTASLLWLLFVDDKQVGMVALDQRKNPLRSSDEPFKVLLEAHKPNQAEIRRLAIRTEYQGHSLSSLLLDRAILHAHERGIEWLDAETTECMTKAAAILEKRYGFFEATRVRRGFWGEIRIWRLDVNRWIEERKDTEDSKKKK